MLSLWEISLLVLLAVVGEGTGQPTYDHDLCSTEKYTPSLGKCFSTIGPDTRDNYNIHGYGRVTLTCSNGWLVWLRRYDGSVSFGRPWRDYRSGFGASDGEFWLGLELLHLLTTRGSYKLRVEMSDWEGKYYYSDYNTFSVGPESDGYRLNVGGYDSNSTAGDSFAHPKNGMQSGMKFSTYDRDNDVNPQSCSSKYSNAGFWYAACHTASPTGKYQTSSEQPTGNGLSWYTKFNSYYSFKSMEFKIKPKE